MGKTFQVVRTLITPLFLFPCIFLPYQPVCCNPRKEDSLEKAVGSGNQPEGVDEDCSADVCVMVQQAGLPWPLASHHVLATIDLPHHLGLPTHCGEIPLAYDRETGGIPNATTREALLHLTWEKQDQGSSGLAKITGLPGLCLHWLLLRTGHQSTAEQTL